MSDDWRIHLMKHALGWPKLYRNHFVTSEGGPDYAEWCKMRSEGLAENIMLAEGSSQIFRVTEAGLEWLKARVE